MYCYGCLVSMACVLSRYRGKDKSDRATVEQVMDPRTRMILFKMISRSVFMEVNGCISTGKEANVYHATTKDGSDRAIKVSVMTINLCKLSLFYMFSWKMYCGTCNATVFRLFRYVYFMKTYLQEL